jgi:hypothetical protein
MSDVHGLKRSERPPRGTRRSLRLRRASAVAGSLAVHLVLFVLVFSAASGNLVSAAGVSGGLAGPMFTVTVVRLAPRTNGQRRQASDLQPLFAKLRVAKAGEALPFTPGEHASDVASLVARIRTQETLAAAPEKPRPERQADAQGSRLPSPNPLSKSERSTDGEQHDADGEAAGSMSTGKLWGAIEPCWRNLGARGRVPVVLEVALDNTGDLRTPPRVIRSTTALINEPRLQAEASALAAIAACVPRGDLKLGGKTYRLEFPAAP